MTSKLMTSKADLCLHLELLTVVDVGDESANAKDIEVKFGSWKRNQSKLDMLYAFFYFT